MPKQICTCGYSRCRCYERKYRQKLKDRICIKVPHKKRCGKCRKTLSSKQFYRSHGAPDGLHAWCKECDNQARTKLSKAAAEYVWTKAEERGSLCVRCGENDKNVLDFHHVRPEDKENSVLKLGKHVDIDKELAKTVLLCSFCHRLETYHWIQSHQKPSVDKLSTDPRSVRNRLLSENSKNMVKRIKAELGQCSVCKRKLDVHDPAAFSAFDFDHIDRSTKTCNISRMVSKTCSEERLLREIAKCRLLCANCHRIHTRQQMGQFVHDNDEE